MGPHIRPQPKNVNVFCSLQLHPSVFISLSIDLLQITFGLPRAVLPPGVQRMATLGIVVNGIRQTWPIHLHLRHLSSRACFFMKFLVQNFVEPVDSQNSHEIFVLKNFQRLTLIIVLLDECLFILLLNTTPC